MVMDVLAGMIVSLCPSRIEYCSRWFRQFFLVDGVVFRDEVLVGVFCVVCCFEGVSWVG